MLESLSPEAVYATKGNIVYPLSGGVDGTQTVANLASMAQARIADAASGSLQMGYAVLTTALTANATAQTALAFTGGWLGVAVPQSGILYLINGNAIQSVVLNQAAGLAPGATSATIVSTAINSAGFPVGSRVVYGFAAGVPAPVIAAQ